MTKSVLESMARAIEPLIRQAQPIYGWDETEIARAALIALRDGVTPGMAMAAWWEIPTHDPERDDLVSGIQAALTHVLQEGEKDTEGG